MLQRQLHRTLLLALAALAGWAGAAGPQQGTRQDVTDASQVAIADYRSESDAPYDYRALNDGGSYYAPGSYGSWFYVAPPAGDITVASVTKPIPAPSYQRPSPALHRYYDYDRYRGPLFG